MEAVNDDAHAVEKWYATPPLSDNFRVGILLFSNDVGGKITVVDIFLLNYLFSIKKL